LELSKELDNIIKIVNPFAGMNAVYIEIRKKDDIYVVGERQKFHQCLINLIKNSIESMPGGGKLIISSQELSGKAVITVADTGGGMTDEQIERLGTPYFSTKETGTGLGTMVIFSIVKAMRGEIKVDSEIGKGTRFTILIPTAEHSPSYTEEIIKQPTSL
jgi:two-component system sporulation sensor kinase B